MNDASLGRGAGARSELADAMQRVAGGDRSAFAKVYDRTSAKLFGICLRILGDRTEAEEALQEAYLNVWRKAGAFDPSRSSPITWLAALARNRAIDRLRARSARQTDLLDEEALEVADPAASAFDGLAAAGETQLLSRCIEELDAKQGRAIRDAFFSGATYAELAARGDVPLGTMKSWIRRGLIQLKECLGR